MAALASADTFRAIGDPTRRAILDLLSDGDRSVNELVDRFDISQPALSQHLKVLRDAGLVTPRRDGRKRIYRIEAIPLREVFDWIAHYERFWDQKLENLGSFLDAEASTDDKEEP